MRRCPACGRSVHKQSAFCESCLAPVDSSPADEPVADDYHGPMQAIARFRHVAEAGYFAYELREREGVPVRVAPDDNFDAMDGSWSSSFVLMVPEASAAPMAQRLDELVRATQGDEEIWTDRPGDPEEWDVAPESGVNWVPIVLTLTAGSLAFWMVRQVHDQPRAAAQAAAGQRLPDDLWDALGGTREPWVQRSENGAGTRELAIDRSRRSAVIREDRDGDGVFERAYSIKRVEAN